MSEPIVFLDGRVTLYCGDCLEELKKLPDNSCDSAVMDPPYHLASIVKRFGGDQAPAKSGKTGAYKRASAGFMGKEWDGGDIAFRPDVWREVYRVLKPGGYLLAFASTRGFGRMSVAIEDAGFITHPMIAWMFGSGFPKATRIKAEGFDDFRYGGQSLKPAIEPVYMGQKPFEKGLSGTENILKHGTGAVNIGACRIPIGKADDPRLGGNGDWSSSKMAKNVYGDGFSGQRIGSSEKGRWPANVIHDGSDEVLAAFPDAPGAMSALTGNEPTASGFSGDVYDFRPGDRKPSVPRKDSGSAARFFYSAKADAADRIGSKHPTVKPIDLMRYLVRLVTPPGGTVLDCFAGTGTTGEAAFYEGFNAVLIEREPEYQEDIRRRMRLCLAGPDERKRESIKAATKDEPDEYGPLFHSLKQGA
jgi:site-specific DNA-methyltransferase (adenine-specific)